MKKFSKLLAVLLALAVVLSFAACGGKNENKNDSVATPNDAVTNDIAASDLKIGMILLHDESIGYDLAHMNGLKQAVAELGLSEDQIIWKKSIPEDAQCADAARDLAAQGCDIIFSDSYGHQEHMLEVASEYPEITFVSLTGDLAWKSNVPNYKNAFTNVFESRYVSGVVAGMKLAELVADGTLTAEKYPNSFDKDGNIKLGYVGAFNYAEVVSGYTAFYLGAKSVVENVTMEVEYTSSWANESAEAASAESLVAKGCVIIGQHADTTGAPSAIERLHNNGTLCFSVGYNVSMLEAAPTAALTSASNNWGVYYKYALGCILNGEEVATDWHAGYAEDAVKITDLGTSCAAGTAEKVEEVIAAIKSGSLHVFDTANFTVNGETVTSYDKVWGYEGHEMISDGYFHESEGRCAPSFEIRIDGIIENAIDAD